MAKWQGTVVPNTGYVEKVYFNTNLSVEEVVSLLSKLETNENDAGFILVSEDSSKIIGFMYLEGTYAIFNPLNEEFYFISDDLDWGFVGWNTTISYPLIINNNVVNSFQMEGNNFVSGTQNNLLTELFSTTPFIGTTPTLYHTKNGIKYEVAPKSNAIIDVSSIDEIGATSNENVLYRVGKNSKLVGGTVVPNTGHVEKIYFNTSLTNDEVTALCKLSTLHADATHMYQLLITSDLSKRFVIRNNSEDGKYDTFEIKDAKNNIYYWTNCDDIANTYWQGTAGWNPNLSNIVDINAEVINHEYGMSSGVENELLKNLVSSTEFTLQYGNFSLYHFKENKKYELVNKDELNELKEKIDSIEPDAIIDVSSVDEIGTNEKALYRVDNDSWQGTQVPNSGYVEKVYLNTNLSYDEVMNFLLQLDYSLFGDTNVFIKSSDNTKMLCASYIRSSDVYIIKDYFSNERYFVSKDWISSVKYVGWNPDFNGVIEFNAEAAEGESVGTQNNLLKELVSTTPFLKPAITLYHIKDGVKYEIGKNNESNSSGNSGNSGSTPGGLYIHNIYLKYLDTVEYMEYIIELSVYSSKSSAFQSYEEFIAIYNNTIHSGIFSGSTAQTPEGSNAVIRFINNHVQTVAIIPNSMSFVPEQCYSFNSANYQSADIEFTDTVIPV